MDKNKNKIPSFTFSLSKAQAKKLQNFKSVEPEIVGVYMVDHEDKIICKGVKTVKGKKVLIPLRGEKIGNTITIK